MYFDEMIRKELVKPSEFSEMESTDEIIVYVRKKKERLKRVNFKKMI